MEHITLHAAVTPFDTVF